MRTSRKIARKLVRTVKVGTFIGVELAAGSLHFVADLMEEGVGAFEAIGDHIEKKLEEIDQERDETS